jgi:hypothetical protein
MLSGSTPVANLCPAAAATLGITAEPVPFRLADEVGGLGL